MVAQTVFVGIHFIGVGGLTGFQRRFVLRLHVQRDQIGPGIVVEISQVATHREVGRMAHTAGNIFFKRLTINVIIQIIILVKIVADVHVGVAIIVHVADGEPQPVA